MATYTDTFPTERRLPPAPPRTRGASGRDTRTRQIDDRQLARFLGWFSIGVGAAEVAAPGAIARLVGTHNRRNLVRAYGAREIAAGLGILAQPGRARWLWARVGGDLLDLATLASALVSPRTDRGSTIAAMTAVAGVTALDVVCAQRLSASRESKTGERAEASLIVNRPPDECYRSWRDFESFPRFMSYIQSVRVTGDRRTHWIARTPAGAAHIEWDAELVDDVPGRRISWRSLPDGDVYHTGSVQFEEAPGRRGTVLRVQIDYSHPGRTVASALAALAGKHPEQVLRKDLRRFKQVLETGEAITTEGQPAGRRSGATWLDSIAR